MHVRLGWNTEYGERKFDIAVEENDFIQLLREAGIGPELAASIPLNLKFQWMEALCRVYTEAESLRVLTGDAAQDAHERVGRAQEDQASFARQARVLLGLETAPEAPGDGPPAGH